MNIHKACAIWNQHSNMIARLESFPFKAWPTYNWKRFKDLHFRLKDRVFEVWVKDGSQYTVLLHEGAPVTIELNQTSIIEARNLLIKLDQEGG